MASPEKYSYFIAKCMNLESLHKCIHSGIWACQERNNPPHPLDLLISAHQNGPVIIIFSVNNQRGWHGYSESLFDSKLNKCSPESEQDDSYICKQEDSTNPLDIQHLEPSVNITKKWHYFHVKWLKHFLSISKQACLSFESTHHLLLKEGNSVNNARNWQQLSESVGRELCNLIDQRLNKLHMDRQLKEEAKKKPSFFKDEENDVSINGHWASVIEKVQAELGKLHLVCPFGSQRYNCSVQGSDSDVFIVYQAKTTQVLSLSPPRQTIKNSEKESMDYTVLEIQRYCELLASGDPRCIETLFLVNTETLVVASEEWKNLCTFRQLFLTRSCFDKYMKEAQGNTGLKQLQKWKESNKELQKLTPKLNKLGYIALRLLQNARDMVSFHTLKVFRDCDSIERKELLDVRQGLYNYSDYFALVERYLSEIADQEICFKMHTDDDVKSKVDHWLITCRIQDLQLHPPVICNQNSTSTTLNTFPCM
ncbi:uncharacterized protein LOC131945033 isoform X2 [Physella acuta]|nr:uncharacterized protein LOC131945033 isoform X2 [Physella acuta]